MPVSPGCLSIVGGDLNICPDPTINRNQQSVKSDHWNTLLSCLPHPHLDAVRHAPPQRRLYTCTHVKNGSWSNIDRIMFREHSSSYFTDANIFNTAPASDHKPVKAEFNLFTELPSSSPTLPTTSSFLTCRPPSLFFDPSYAAALLTLKRSLRRNSGALPPLQRWEAFKEKARLSSTMLPVPAALHTNASAVQKSCWFTLRFNPLSPTTNSSWHQAEAELAACKRERQARLAVRAHSPTYIDGPAEAEALRGILASRTRASTLPPPF
ncbi:hypothetical protein JCM11251_007272 [Rhodosporidiobolus azoricus]